MRTLKAALFAAALAGATGAQAAESSIWVQCDGLPKPEGAGTTAAKLGSVILTLGLSSFAFEGGGDPEYGEAGVRACTKALAEPGLAPFWGRHVSLLRSRALHAVEAGDLDSALKDLEATRAVSAGHVDDVAFNRSLGVSIKLFEAALLAKRGETDKAEALAFEAAAARPYSARVQGLSAALLGIDPAHGAAEDRILTRRAQLDPDALMARAAAREWSDPAGAADDWAAVVAVVRQLPPEGARLRESMEYVPGSAALLPYPLARAAVAAARAGRVGEAETMLNELEALRPWFPAKPPGKRDMAHAAEVRATSVAAIERTVPYRRLTRIWLATRAGRFDEARTLVNERVPAEPATFEVLGLIAKGLGRSPDPAAKGLEDLRKSVRTDRADALKVLQYAEALPLLEQVRKSTHRPEKPLSGMPGIDHFDKQTGLRDIEVSGLDGLAIAEEQAVLHAAQVARAQQVGRLVVVGRRDFEQFLVRRHDERPVSTSPNPQHVKTILEFVVPTAATPLPSGWTRREGLAIDTEEAWAALSPIYLNVAEVKR